MKNILIIKHGSLGDIISSTSVLNDLRKHYSKDRLFVITTENFRFFFQDSPFTNNIIVDKRGGIYETFKIIKKIINLKFNLIIDLQNSNRTSIYAFFLKIFSSTDINGTGIFANIRYKNDYSKLPTVIDGLSNQVEMLGISCTRKPCLDWLSNKTFDWSLIQNKRYFIINSGCSQNNSQKKWNKKNFLHIAKYLISKNILPVLIGANKDKESTDYIFKNSKNILNLYNRSSLNIIYEISKKSLGAISNDTGPAHLIAASGCKIHLVLSSFSNIKTVIPRGYNVSFTQKNNIDDVSSSEVIKELDKNFNL